MISKHYCKNGSTTFLYTIKKRNMKMHGDNDDKTSTAGETLKDLYLYCLHMFGTLIRRTANRI